MLVWLQFGGTAVSVFIALSGYCLMLPVVRNGETGMPGGFWSFVGRRARRIMPPYYAALFGTLLLVLLVPGLDLARPSTGHDIHVWNWSLSAFQPGILISHLLLVHNFQPAWMHEIDYPMWSVATEWQIYFLFALVLLPVWRHTGMPGLFISAAALAKVLDHFAPAACFEYTILFAFGMAAAVYSFGNGSKKRIQKHRVPWGILAATFVLLWRMGDHLIHKSHFLSLMPLWNISYMPTLLPGLATVCFILYCVTLILKNKKHSKALRLLQTRWAEQLGGFSYSLYLIHAPVLSVFALLLRPHHLNPVVSLFAMFGLAVPCALIISFFFHLTFERPFLRSRPRRNAGLLRGPAGGLIDAPAEGATVGGWESSPP